MATYSPQYCAIARKAKLRPSELAPYWTRARRMADAKFGEGNTSAHYWAHAIASLKTMLHV